jgi:hypothetical protein
MTRLAPPPERATARDGVVLIAIMIALTVAALWLASILPHS